MVEKKHVKHGHDALKREAKISKVACSLSCERQAKRRRLCYLRK